MSGMRNVPDELASIAKTLESGTEDLDSMGSVDTANAGGSTELVAQAVGRLAQASVGVSRGLHEAAANVDEARKTYIRTDHLGD